MAKIKLVSWNVNGLRAIYKKGFLDWLRKEKPHILCLQETKATFEQLPSALKDIRGYLNFFSAAERKGYSGVATYTKVDPQNVTYGIGVKKFDSEGRILINEFEDFWLYNIYFPNGKASKKRLDYKLAFYKSFSKHIKKQLASGKKIVICGDVNTAHKEIDLARPKQNEKISGFLPEERAWIDSFLGLGFHDTFRVFNSKPNQYTWWDYKSRARERNVGWRIDYFFVSDNLKDNLSKAFIRNKVYGSDHCPIGVELMF